MTRVSTDGQTLEAQHEALRAAGAEQIFAEKISGATRDRPALEGCLGSLEHGDTVPETKLDRLARSTRDLLNVLALITDYGATFESLTDTWADTTTPHGRLMVTILGGLAEFERHLILAGPKRVGFAPRLGGSSSGGSHQASTGRGAGPSSSRRDANSGGEEL